MRYANLISRSSIINHGRPAITVEDRRAFTASRAAISLATANAKRFAANVAPLVNRDGSFDRSAIMRAAIRSARARMEVTGDAWGVCLSYALTGAWAAAKASRPYRAA